MSFPILTLTLSPSPEASKTEKSFQFTDITYKFVDLDLACPPTNLPRWRIVIEIGIFPSSPWRLTGLCQSRRAHVRALINAL